MLFNIISGTDNQLNRTGQIIKVCQFKCFHIYHGKNYQQGYLFIAWVNSSKTISELEFCAKKTFCRLIQREQTQIGIKLEKEIPQHPEDFETSALAKLSGFICLLFTWWFEIFPISFKRSCIGFLQISLGKDSNEIYNLWFCKCVLVVYKCISFVICDCDFS